MKKVKIILLFLGITFCSSKAALAASIYNIAGNLYLGVDTLISSSGNYTTSGGLLSAVLTDGDAGTYAFSRSPNANVTLGWLGNNYPTGELAVFELGVPNSFKVTINGKSETKLSTYTGIQAGGYNLNRAIFDLSDFGLLTNGNVNINLSIVGNFDTIPSLSFVGSTGLTSIPLPAAFWLFCSGIMGLLISKRQKTV